MCTGEMDDSANRVELSEKVLIALAKQGNRRAFDRLYTPYERRVFGFIRGRVANDDDAQDVAAKTRETIWHKLPLYDPDRRGFYGSILYWATLRLLDYYEETTQLNRRRVLLSQMRCRFSDPEGEEKDGGDALAPLSPSWGQTSSPEELIILAETQRKRAEAYTALLPLTFSTPSPPHQLLAFGFAELLGWKPRNVAAHLSNSSLRTLEERLEIEYVQNSQLPEDLVFSCFQPLRRTLDGRFGNVVQEPHTVRTYAHLVDRVIGKTILADYYTGKPPADHAANIVAWAYAVKRRVRAAIERQTEGPLHRLEHDDE